MSGMMIRGCCCGGGGVSCCANLTLTWTGTISGNCLYDATDCTNQFGSGCQQSFPALNIGNWIFGTRFAAPLNPVFTANPITMNRLGNMPGTNPWCWYVGQHPNNTSAICAPTWFTGQIFTGADLWIEQPLGTRVALTQWIATYYAAPWLDGTTTRWEAGLRIVARNPTVSSTTVSLYFTRRGVNVTGCPTGISYAPGIGAKSVTNYRGYPRTHSNSWTCLGNDDLASRDTNWIQFMTQEPTVINITIT